MAERTMALGDTAKSIEYPSHGSIMFNSNTRTLTITLPFDTHLANFYLMQEFATWHASLLSTLSSYRSSLGENTTVIIYINLPYRHTHSISNQRAQRELLSQLVEVLNGFKEGKLDRVDIVMKVVKGDIEWTQVQLLVPVWGLRSDYWKRRVYLKEGERKAAIVRSGDDWEVKLKKEFREMTGKKK